MLDIMRAQSMSPSNSTTSSGFKVTGDMPGIAQEFVMLATPEQSGAPDNLTGPLVGDALHQRVHESLARSMKENAPIWRELSKL